MFRVFFKYINLFSEAEMQYNGINHSDVIRFEEEINEFAIKKN